MANGQVEMSTASIFKIIAIVLFFVLLYFVRDVLIILLFSIILASGVSPFADWFETKKIPRLLGVLLLYLAVFGLLAFLLSLVIPIISVEISQLTESLPRLFEKISGALEKARQADTPGYFDFIGEIQNLLDALSQFLHVSSQSTVSFVVSIFGGILSFLAIIVISFYLSVMKNGITRFLESILPERYESYVVGLVKRSERKVGRWLQGQILLALTVGLIVFVGLSLLGIKFALLLGIIAMIMELVPLVGPAIAAVPAVLLALLQDPILAIWVVVLYVVVQQIENNVLTPLVMGRATGLNPVTVIVALFVGGKLAGILGVIVAVPVAVVIVEVLDDIAKRKGEHKVIPQGDEIAIEPIVE